MSKYIFLKEVADIIMGQSPASSTYNDEGKGLPFYQGKAEFGVRHPIVKKWCSAPLKIADQGDILLSVRAPVGPTNICNVKSCIGRVLAAIRCKKNKADHLFIWFYLRSIEKRIASKGVGSTFTAIGREEISKIQVPSVNYSVQRKIASILEKAESARGKRKEANRLTDEFLKSAFLEMFGDPIRNPKRWIVVQLNDMIQIERENIIPEEIKRGTKYIGLEHIESETGKILDFEIVDTGQIKSNKFKFSSNHILLGKLRPYLNKVVLPDFTGVCSTDILPILPKSNIVNKYFIAYLFRHTSFVDYATKRSTGANLPRISPKVVDEFKTYLPSFKLQQKFAELVQKVEKLKEKQRGSERELNNLFNSLMQRAFRGELV